MMLHKALANGFYSLAYVYAAKQHFWASTLAGVFRIINVLSEMAQIISKQHHQLYLIIQKAPRRLFSIKIDIYRC